MNSSRWAIVLAGGDGERMQPFIRRWLGHPRPKQYCSFTGRRTMLEHTLDRAETAVGPSRVVTVLNADHRRFLESPQRITLPGRLIVQPQRCDTGPGVFLPLTAVMAQDPEAFVAVMPSDHFIHPGGRFQAILEEAFELAEFLPGQIVMLAAQPDGPEADYGWIAPGTSIRDGKAFMVGSFKEKPKPEDAEAFFRRSWLWNTMIIVARAAALWEHAQNLRPEMIARFSALKGWIGLPEEQEAMELAYRSMPSVNLSRDLLEPLAAWTVALPMTGVRWSDWGRPERVEQTLAAIGEKGAFAPAMAPVATPLPAAA